MNQDPDLIRLARLAMREETVFSDIYKEYANAPFKYVPQILPDQEDVVDVIQETFVTNLTAVRSVNKYV